jgi:hypothetical protein
MIKILRYAYISLWCLCALLYLLVCFAGHGGESLIRITDVITWPWGELLAPLGIKLELKIGYGLTVVFARFLLEIVVPFLLDTALIYAFVVAFRRFRFGVPKG